MVGRKVSADSKIRGIIQAFSLAVLFLVSLASGQNDTVSDTGIVQVTPVETTQLMETPVQDTQLMVTSLQPTTQIMVTPVQTTTQIMVTPVQTPAMIDENPERIISSTVVMPTQTPDQNNRVTTTPVIPDWAIFFIVFGGVVIIAVLASSVGIFVRFAHQKYAKEH